MQECGVLRAANSQLQAALSRQSDITAKADANHRERTKLVRPNSRCGILNKHQRYALERQTKENKHIEQKEAANFISGVRSHERLTAEEKRLQTQRSE